MDYSLLVGIHHCGDSLQPADEALLNLCDASAGVFAIKCSSGLCHFFAWFVLQMKAKLLLLSHVIQSTKITTCSRIRQTSPPGAATWRTGRNIHVIFDFGPFPPLC